MADETSKVTLTEAERMGELGSRAERAEAVLARVRALVDDEVSSGRHINGSAYVLVRELLAALNTGSDQ